MHDPFKIGKKGRYLPGTLTINNLKIMKTSKNLTIGLVEITSNPNGIDYDIELPNGSILTCSEDDWHDLHRFVTNSMEFIDKN